MIKPPDVPSNLWEFLGWIIAPLLGLIGLWYGKKNESETKIKLKELETKDTDVQSLEKSIAELKKQIQELKIEKIEFEKKVTGIKVGFNLMFNQYKRIFKDEPSKLEMLDEVSAIIKEL